MAIGRNGPATRLARPVDLSSAWNATDADVGGCFHPRYRPALGRLPEGAAVFRGLPFELGVRQSGRRWILLDEPVTIDLRGLGPASHVVVAHFADSWRETTGERPPGMPVGWVLPAGEPLAQYELLFDDGTTRSTLVRRRFEIADGIIGWGFLPFAAVGHRADEVVDWRGPHARQESGRYAPAGHAGPLTMLPGAWGPAQSGVADFVPTRDDDVTYWLHVISLDGGPAPGGGHSPDGRRVPARRPELVEIRLAPLGEKRPGTGVVVAAVTLFNGTADPVALAPRRQIMIHGADLGLPDVDLGVAIRSRRPDDPIGGLAGATDDGPVGWGRPRTVDPGSRPSSTAGPAAILDLATTRDAMIRFDDWEVAVADLDRGVVSADGRMTVRPLPAADVRVDVRVSVGGEPTPARVRFVAADGRYLPPLGHRDEVNPGLCEDSGADVILGRDTYAYVPGTFQVDLPLGPVDVEIVKGFDHRPVRRRIEVAPETRDLAFALERPIDLRREGWRSSDSHVHYVSPSTVLLQAAAEDVTFVHLLATQWGDHVTNVPDLSWGAGQDPTGQHAVVMGTENRQNLLGHLALLGSRRPVLPMAAGGAPEGRLGGAVTELLGDWADRCHAGGGLVVGAHFPLPYAEIAADIVAGRIDAVEMQCFAPGLDNPSILEWYRFLNCGYRLPVLGGTDKMSAEVPVGAVRTYARLDPDAPPTFESWATAVRAGRTFATSGPVVELSVDGHAPGDVLALPSSGGRLEVQARARASQAIIGCIELVVNGRIVARVDAPRATDDLRLQTTIVVGSGAWIAARARSDHDVHSAFITSMACHTSPVYVDVVDRPLFAPDDAEAILQVIDGTAIWLRTLAAISDPAERSRMVERIAASGAMLRERVDRTRRTEA